ncbi:hypothetical protein TRVL_02582 [Trypanosoma vivax]|uniref:Uncharacterized protein n=1 Tax=Trypanosoma vivax (strain Y486) TaxID=1055687 RepID=G0U057_TRYVY|nr:hypothetical protein TRVL_02582 [Trypanosoma vivax]CCC49454.1 hypothetical protein TVY486_0800620 [Trypanosoma vivax Y486]
MTCWSPSLEEGEFFTSNYVCCDVAGLHSVMMCCDSVMRCSLGLRCHFVLLFDNEITQNCLSAKARYIESALILLCRCWRTRGCRSVSTLFIMPFIFTKHTHGR